LGYDVHITRAAHWTESSERPITLEEWLSLVKADPEFNLQGQAEATTPQGDVVRYENEGLAVWIAYPKAGEGGNQAWFDFQDGEVIVKNPDEEILRKMRAVARALGGHVQGDDGEAYD
jgi:hypothetical protein